MAASAPSLARSAARAARSMSRGGRGRRRRRLDPELVVGAGLLVLLGGATLLAPWLTWHDPNRSLPGMSLLGPQPSFPFGTDSLGRDIFSRVLHGGRVSLRVAVPAVALALALGLLLGLPAGYLGGRVDQVTMRLLDLLFAFPSILLAIVVVSILGPSLANLVLTIGLIYAPRMARVVRAPTMAVAARDFVEAARALGASDLRLVLRHVLPNIASPVIVEVSLALGLVIITETALSFLGLGPPPPDPTWGAMLSENRAFMAFAPWTVLAPGAAIMLAVAAFLMVGHGLRVALDPRRAAG